VEIIKRVDEQGRLVLPKEWGEKYAESGLVVVRIEGERIVLEPLKLPDLTKFFDSMEVDLGSGLSNWRSVKGELVEIR